MSFATLRTAFLLVGAGLLAACGGPAEPAPDPESEGARFNADVDGDGIGDVRIGYGEMAADAGEENASSGAGEAHVHGKGELALVREGNLFSVTIDAPLANFGVPETAEDLPPEISAAVATAISLVSEQGAACTAPDIVTDLRRSGDHGAGAITLDWTCANPDAVTGVRADVFEKFPGFESLDAVYLGDNGMGGATLDAGDPVLTFGD